MAVGLKPLPQLHSVAGVRIGVCSAGIKVAGRRDLVLFEIAEGSATAGVFTKNAFCAAPVQIAKKHLASAPARYLVINTGNANAGTGEDGYRRAVDICEAVAAQAGCTPAEVLPFSTGVIGETLASGKIIASLPAAQSALSDNAWADAATGIMTTDTLPKGSSRQFDLGGELVTITGLSKGAGMIKPNMATMLAYVATDANIDASLLDDLLVSCVEKSFNRITVDGDTSTNDSCILVATGKSAGAKINAATDADYMVFAQQLEEVFVELAQAIIRDGEGATKFVTVEITEGLSSEECLKAAYAIAESPLVKTALFASDPNWGRILAALGRAGLDALDVDRVGLSVNGVELAINGGLSPNYREADGVKAMQQEEIHIVVSLGRGSASETVWTSDLSYDYVKINADYRS